MQGALLALHPFLASPNAVEPSLSVFSPQTIIMFYIVTACEEALHMPSGPVVVRPFASSTSTLSSSSASYSTATLSSSSAIRLAL
jgi:hypothetical protein